MGLAGGLVPLYLYPTLFVRAWPAYLGVIALVLGCVVAWWEPRPRWRAVGATLAVLAGLWLWFLGWVLAGFEACGFEPGCPARPERTGAALKGIAINLGAAVVLVAAWRTARSTGGRWMAGLVLALAGTLAVIGTIGFLGLLG